MRVQQYIIYSTSGESGHENGTLAFLDYEEDQVTAYMLFIGAGLIGEKV